VCQVRTQSYHGGILMLVCVERCHVRGYPYSSSPIQERSSVRHSDGGPLKAALDAAAKTKRSPSILVNTEGKPWTGDGFRSSWRKACTTAGIVGVTFHDLRGDGRDAPRARRSRPARCAHYSRPLGRNDVGLGSDSAVAAHPSRRPGSSDVPLWNQVAGPRALIYWKLRRGRASTSLD
jgi:hypothetical protein